MGWGVSSINGPFNLVIISYQPILYGMANRGGNRMANDKLGTYHQATVLITEAEITRLYQAINGPSIQPVPDPIADPVPINTSRNAKLLKFAAGEIGVKEIPGSGNNPRIVEYHKYSTKDNVQGMADSVPWCASFICFCLEMVGMTSTNSKMAQSYKTWGKDSSNDPLPGDIWVMTRGGSLGHVGVLVDLTSTRALVLGGNQADECNLTWFSRSREIGIRRSSKQFDLTVDQTKYLYQLARDLKAGRSINEGGSVA